MAQALGCSTLQSLAVGVVAVMVVGETQLWWVPVCLWAVGVSKQGAKRLGGWWLGWQQGWLLWSLLEWLS